MRPNPIASPLLPFLLLALLPLPASAQGARLRLDHLNHLADRAKETVDVTVDSGMLKQAAGVLAQKGADSEKVQALLEGITGIYVKSFRFGVPDAYSDTDIETVRKQLASGWSRIVGVRGKGDLTEIYFWVERDTTGGLAVIAAKANELTVVNIVGRVDLAALAALGPFIPKLSDSLSKPK